METLREEEVLALEEAVFKKLEERLTPLLHQIAMDSAKTATHQLRQDLMSHISRHEAHIQRITKTEAAMTEISRAR